MSHRSIKTFEKIWQFKTSSANDLFQEGRMSEALPLYTEALRLSEWLVDNIVSEQVPSIPVTHIFIISCNNLINTHIELQEIGLAEAMLRRVIYFLLHKISLRQDEKACQCELRKAFLAYASFCQHNNTGDPVALLEELKDPSFSFTD